MIEQLALADDQFRSDWVARSRCEFTVTFGFAPSADCRVLGEPDYLPTGSEFRMRLPDGAEVEAWLPLLGRQNVANALAAGAAAQAVGASSDDIVAGLARATPVRGRLRAVQGANGATIIDDSYNANPASVRAALDHLAVLRGRRVLVLGNMAELGPTAAALHREVGEYARGRCDLLLTIGDLASEAAAAFGPDGRPMADIEAARAALEPLLANDATVLVKGSRVMGLDRLVKMLEANGNGARVH